MHFEIQAVCISNEKGTQKRAVPEIELIDNFGIKGDAHGGSLLKQVSFLAEEEVDEMRKEGLKLFPGAFGENILTRKIDWTNTEIGGMIRINDCYLEIMQKGKECHSPCSIYDLAGRCIMPEKSIFAKVIKGGMIHAGHCGDYHI